MTCECWCFLLLYGICRTPCCTGKCVSSQENFLTLTGLCCRGAALLLNSLLKHAQKALKEVGKEIACPGAVMLMEMDMTGSLRSLTIVAIKSAIHYLYGIGCEEGTFEKYKQLSSCESILWTVQCPNSSPSLLCDYCALKVQIIFQFRRLILSGFITL